MAFQAKRVTLKTRTAAELFTDRTEPQKAFWDKYEKMTAEQGMIDIIHYYGVGGIGKTTLLKKLVDDLLEKGNKNVIMYSFESNQKKDEFILALSRQVSMRLNIDFPVFGYAYIKYMRAVGMSDEEIERKLKTDNSGIHNSNRLAETLKIALAFGSDFIPILGNTVGKIGENLIDLFVERLKNKEANSNAELSSYLERIDSLTPDVILDELHTYFSRDCYEALMNTNEPFVIMLDGYEFMNDSLKYGDLSFKNDLWICGTDHNPGIIQSLPNVLWVVSGREKIKWDSILPPEDSHLLGNLSLEDASEYFLKANDKNNNKMSEDLITGLYRLTNGTPVFMDLCFQIYENGSNLCIDDFGKDTREIAKRYLDNLSLDQQTTLRFLCGLTSTWNDEMINYVSTHVPQKRYDILISSSLEIIKEHSFVEKYDNTYKLHETLRNAVRANTDPSELRIIEDTTYKYFSEIISDEDCSISKRVDAILMLHNNTQDFCSLSLDVLNTIMSIIYGLTNHFHDQEFLSIANKIYDAFVNLLGEDDLDTQSTKLMMAMCYLNMGKNAKAKGLVEEIYQKAHDLWGDKTELTICSLMILGSIYSRLEELDTAMRITKTAYELALEAFDKDDFLVLRCLHELSLRYSENNNPEEALKIEEQVYEALRRTQGDDSNDALNSLDCLSDFYSDYGDKEKGLELAKKVYERIKGLYGNDNPDTLNSLHKYADLLFEAGDIEKAIEHETLVYEGYKESFGEDDSDTLSSMSSLAHLYAEAGDIEKAIELEKKAYNLGKESLGELDDDTLAYLSGLIFYYYRNEEIENSIEYCKEYYIKTKHLNNNEVEYDKGDFLTDSYYTLANLMFNLGQLIGWLTYHEEYNSAIELTENLYDVACRLSGSTTDSSLHVLEKLASYYSASGNTKKAIQIAAEIYERESSASDTNNEYSLSIMHDLAYYYSEDGDTEKAIEFGKEAYEKRRSLLGAENEDTLASLDNLICIYSESGDLEKAIELGKEAYTIRQTTLGDNNEDTLSSLYQLISLYAENDDPADAALLADKYYYIQEELLGNNNEETLAALHNLAFYHSEAGNIEKAIQLGKEVYERRLVVLGENDEDTLISLNNLAFYYSDAGDTEKAIDFGEEAYERRLTVLGENDEDTLISLSNLVSYYSDAGNKEKSVELEELYHSLCEKYGYDDVDNE